MEAWGRRVGLRSPGRCMESPLLFQAWNSKGGRAEGAWGLLAPLAQLLSGCCWPVSGVNTVTFQQAPRLMLGEGKKIAAVRNQRKNLSEQGSVILLLRNWQLKVPLWPNCLSN